MTNADIAYCSEAAVAAVFPHSIRIRRHHADGYSIKIESMTRKSLMSDDWTKAD